MSIKQHIENAIKNIEAEREREIAVVKDRVTRDKIVPNNAEIERHKTDAINALTQKLNENISQLQQQYAADKNAIVEASEKKKSEFAQTVIQTETSVVRLEYDNKIKQLTDIAGTIKE